MGQWSTGTCSSWYILLQSWRIIFTVCSPLPCNISAVMLTTPGAFLSFKPFIDALISCSIKYPILRHRSYYIVLLIYFSSDHVFLLCFPMSFRLCFFTDGSLATGFPHISLAFLNSMRVFCTCEYCWSSAHWSFNHFSLHFLTSSWCCALSDCIPFLCLYYFSRILASSSGCRVPVFLLISMVLLVAFFCILLLFIIYLIIFDQFVIYCYRLLFTSY